MKKKITISLSPSKTEFRFAKGNGGTPKKYPTAVRAYMALERTLKPFVPHQLRDKTCVRVVQGTTVLNETLDSQNPSYLCWATVNFLEDFLEHEYLMDRNNIFRQLDLKP